MKLLQELLQLKDPITLIEGKDDLDDLIDKYIEGNRMYHFEGARGVSNFDKLINVLDYRDIDEFLSDNPGCLEAMIEWIKSQNNDDWAKKFEAEIRSDEHIDAHEESNG